MNTTKSAFVAIVGKPNVGKSSLLNRIIGEKLAIVTAKPQTTRTRITGILTEGETQLVFMDTPGLHRAKTKLSEFMVRQVKESVSDVEVAVLVVEPHGRINSAERELIESIKTRKIPALLVINKIDTLKDKGQILERIEEIKALHDFDAYLPVSALEGQGIDALMDEVRKYAKEGPHYFESDMMTDQPEKVLASEMIREKMLLNLQEEIPHGVGVVLEKMREREDGSLLDVEATIYCEKKSHKGIIIGKNGGMLKTIASAAREDMEAFFDIRVNLQVWVKVKEGWRNREGIMRTLGYQ